MFRHGKIRVISAVAFAALLSVIAITVMGTSPTPVNVKLTPTMVSVDTTSLSPKLAQTEMDAVWRLFDRDTATTYKPGQTARITVSLSEPRTVKSIRVYGAPSYQLTVYRDNAGTWELVPSLTGQDLTTLESSWNSLVPAEPVTSSHFLLEFVPQGNITTGLAEIELWGLDGSTEQDNASHLTLGSLRTPAEALAVLSTPSSPVLELPAAPSELSVAEGSTPAVTIGIIQKPALFKRAYLLYDGYNLVRPVSIQRRINGLSWTGGFAISQPENTSPSWSSYLEEINPAWLVQGENRIEFQTTAGNAAIRGLKLIIETDSGWNTVSSVSAHETYDGETSTGYRILASATDQTVQINFERSIQPHILKIHLPGSADFKAGLQYRTGTAWQDVKAGWQIDFAALHTGWNEIELPATVTTDALRMVFNTSGLRIKSGVKVGAINEIRVSTSAVGAAQSTPRIVIAYPRDGEYFGRTAYIQGFATPASIGPDSALIGIEGKTLSNPDGSFSLSLKKDDTRFSIQSDDEAWEPIVTSEYAGRPGASLSLLLNKNSGNVQSTEPSSENRGSAPFADNRDKFTDRVSPGQAKKIQYKGVTLDIPIGAVDKDTDITIIPLTEPDLARLNPGMINVTFPDAGYRFLPHGMKFKKPIKISFGYSKQLFAAGQVDDEVSMYYYDEALLRWQKLTRMKVEPALSVVESESDHFTDIINSTLVVPEHPQALSFNPNSLKDIKAADPTANVNLIEPPTANNKGSANLSYPIEVPPGRNKLQPNIGVQYNSGGGNGWMGLGWDIATQAITIDTRWGVPRYDATDETETYMLDGEQLTPLAHRGALKKRADDTTTLGLEIVKIFHSRVEGQFRKIIRHGSSPKNYWWEVIDKNGTRYTYGGNLADKIQDESSVLKTDEAEVFRWALREVRDTNDNYITYDYDLVKDVGVSGGSVEGRQLYLKKITYTGHGITAGRYTVTFYRDNEVEIPGQPYVRRSDVIIDARGGFKQVTAHLLKRIEVKYDAQLIRRYDFTYDNGAFSKTLLKSVNQYGAKETLFHTHTFDYYDDITDGNAYKGFFPSTQWTTQEDGLDVKFLGVSAGPSALSGSEGMGVGGSFSIGFAPLPTKYLSFNGMIGSGMNTSKGTLSLVDIDGDGLADKVFRDGGSIKYHRNTVTPRSNPSVPVTFDSQVYSAENMGLLSEDESMNFNFGGQAYIFGLNLIGDMGYSFTNQRSYISDVNGDGLMDVVKNGQVWFNRWQDKSALVRTPAFSPTSGGTEFPIAAGSMNPAGMLPEATFSSIEEELVKQNPLADVVRRWVAPYSGRVAIDGDVRLVDVVNDPGATLEEKQRREAYKTADGVRVAIQHEGTELWSASTTSTDYSAHQPQGVSDITVNRGDRIYFRVQSKFDGAFDEVSWAPRISYLETTEGGVVPVAATDANSLDPYVFQADQEFVYAGRVSPMEMPFRGKVRATGILHKTAVTTDDVRISVYRFTDSEIETYFKNRRDYTLMHTNRTPLARYSLKWNEIGDLTLDGTPDIDVQAKDKLFVIVEIDSNIDLTKLQWATDNPLKIVYTEAFRPTEQPTYENGDPLLDDEGNPIGWEPGGAIQVRDDDGNYLIEISPQQEMNFYPDNHLNQAQSDFTAAETGWLMITPQVTPKPTEVVDDYANNSYIYLFDHTSEMAFTVKQPGEQHNELVEKRFLPLQGGQGYNPRQQSFAIPVYKGDKFFLDFSTRDPELYATLESTGANVHYIRPQYTVNLPNVPLNKANSVSEWYHGEGTATVLPVLAAKADAPALSGEVVLHVSYEYYPDENQLPVRVHVVDRSIHFDTRVPFNPYAHAFDLSESGVSFRFSYSVENADLAAALSTHAVTIPVQTNFNATQQEFTALELFTAPSLSDNGKALLPIGGYPAKVAIAPVIKQNGALISEVSGTATLTVIRRYTVYDEEGNPQIQEQTIAQRLVELTAGKRFNPGEHTFDVDVQAHDTLVMSFSTEDNELAALDLDWGLWTQIRRHIGGNAPSATPPSMLHRYGSWDFFANSYRGWAYAGYNSQGMVNGIELKDQPIIQSRLAIDESEFDNIESLESDHDRARSKRVKDFTAFPAVPQPEKQRWFTGDEGWRVKANRMSSSRMGLDYVHLPRAADLVVSPEDLSGAGAIAPPRLSLVELETTMGIGFIVNINETTTPGQGVLDFIDMNGDRFPDVVGGNTIQYTEMVGGLGSTFGNTGTAFVRDSESVAHNIAPGGTVQQAVASAKGYFNPPSGNANQPNRNSSFGLTGSLGERNNDVKADYIDINGDGLPDRVYNDGLVALNLGYSFAQAENWSFAVIDDSETNYVNAGVSYNDGVKGYAGSLALTYSRGKTSQKLLDMNGDGLPDRVYESGSGLMVAINKGNGFDDYRAWTGAAATLGNNQSFSLSGGFSFNITVGPICIVACYIDINPGVSISTNTARAESMIQDVNGDGYADRLASTDENKLTVALNTTGRTNLLKTVKRPLGGKFEIEYAREGNTYDMPQSQWVMDKVHLSDGMGNTYRTDYAYADGYQDRYEREFYGFKTVTENQAPETIGTQRKNIARQIIQTYYISDYYRKGLVQSTVTRDMKVGYGNVWSKSENEYVLYPVLDDSDTALSNTSFPGLYKTTTSFYDGSQANEESRNKYTYQTFYYDKHGNVERLEDEGELFTTADNVTATITYYNDPGKYIIKPETIIVTNGAKELRNRVATYYANGNLHTLTLHNTKSPKSEWTMTYHGNGNLKTITDPVGYVLTYSYDLEVQTYVTEIHDNFPVPYISTASYNTSFGQLDWSKDLNSNYQVNLYDEFGRMVSICGPYDTSGPTCEGTAAGTMISVATGRPTIAFKYRMPSVGGDNNNIGGSPLQLARAITENKAVSSKEKDAIIIKTITFADGMKRIIQTKKDADVDVGTDIPDTGMTVSGKVVFDELGRVEKQGQPEFDSGASLEFGNYSDALHPTFFSYDTLDRTVEVLTPDTKAPNGYAKTTTIYTFGHLDGKYYAKTIVMDPEGNKVNGAGFRGTKISYKDVDDRIMGVVEYNRVKNPETGTAVLTEIKTTYDYDALGQITTVVDNRGNTTTVEYDKVGNRTAITNPDTGRTAYTYDANGNLKTKRTANLLTGTPITYMYDFNRLKKIEYPNSDAVEYFYGDRDEGYNRAGRIMKVTDESGTEERFYGKLGETLREEKTVLAKTPAVQKKKFSTDYIFDSFGRMTDMTYPDGEKLHYAYDNGGLLKAAWGEKSGNRYNYITSLQYDKFGQRTRITYGNGTKSTYTYNELTRRLSNLTTVINNGRSVQNISYDYDLVGNIGETWNNIAVPTSTALPAGPVRQKFEYDDLYQIVDAKGWYSFGPGKGNNYHNEFFYDTIGNFTRKKQDHEIVQPSTTKIHPKETNYVLNYQYMTGNSTKPHAVTDAGDKLYAYDAAGNMLGWTHKQNGTRRNITWNEENRVRQVEDNGKSTYFLYDDSGERVIKRGQHGETIYVNRFFSIRNGELGTKSIYAGETRVVSKLVKTPPTNTANSTTTTSTTTTSDDTTTVPGINGLDNGQGKKLGIIRRLPDGYQVGVNPPVEKDQFFYHGDHLGSSNMITDAYGAVYQHLEYFPYGETWIEEGGFFGGNTPGYKFTGKELDPETGLYYYGARYYDPVLSRWISADPILGKYLPTGDKEKDMNLPGMGGVFNPLNLGLYTYGHHNPVRMVDPDGNSPISVLAKRIAKVGIKHGIKEFAEKNIQKRLGKHFSAEMRKEFASDLADVLTSLDSSPLEIALELVPIVGDIYGATKFGKQIAKVYGKLQDLENKYVEKIVNSLPKEQRKKFIEAMRNAGVRDARKDNIDGIYSPGKNIEGHHVDYVRDSSGKASDPRNIEFMPKKDHIELHKRDYE